MIYFINKITKEVWAYESLNDAKSHNIDFDNLIECPEPISSHFRKFNFESMTWEIDVDAQNKALEQENIIFLSSETRRTSDAIEVLSDAIEFELATNEEIVQHKELRKYRLMLSRVQNQQEWPLNPIWPTCPEFFKPKE